MSDPRAETKPSQSAADRFPFPRPTTLLNSVLERTLLLFRVRQLDPEELARLRARSMRAMLELGAARTAVEAVSTRSEWRIVPGRAPSNAWGGEVLERNDGPPHVAMYEDCPLTRLPSTLAFRIAAQLAVDHMYGHLYEYYRGAENWGEEVACRWQVRLLRQRGGPGNRILAVVVAVTHRFHKQIPLSNY
jgi:hypothetical protein